MSKQLDDAFYTSLHELQAIDFVLVELNLYLDTHPNDMSALQQFNHFVNLRKNAVQHFEANYGPLMHFGHSSSEAPWQWIESPWPWQV